MFPLPSSSEEGLFRFEHESMTTRFSILVDGEDPEYARQAAAAAFREIDRIAGLLNRFDPGSDVGQINLLAPGASVRVGIETLECIEKALWVQERTGGLFDPAVGSGVENLRIDRGAFTVGWSDAGTGRIDLGGIGKGYALDRAASVLDDWEIDDALLDGGGSSVLARGRGWPVGIGGPWGEKIGFSSLELRNRALSGSGTEVKGGHILDPRTGQPARTALAAWALHPEAALSDALSTAFFLMDAEDVDDLCRTGPETAGVRVDPDGLLHRFGV